LISLASAILLTGCGKKVNINDEQVLSQTEITTESTIEATTEAETEESADTQINAVVEKSIVDKLIDELSDEHGIEIEKLPNDLLRIKSINYGDVIFCNDMDELKKYVHLQEPSFYDVRNAIRDNNNIPEEYKVWLYEGIDNLEKNLPNMDLTVLYYNISRLKCLCKNSEEIINDTGKSNAKAYFNSIEGTVVVNEENVTKWTFLHEVFGHGSTQVRINDKITKYTEINHLIFELDEDGTYSVTEVFLGDGIEEAKADMITYLAYGMSIDDMAYKPEYETLRIFMETTGLTLEELINGGTMKLIQKMYENDINDPHKYIEALDVLCNSRKTLTVEIDSENTMKNNIRAFIMDYCDDKIKKGESKYTVAEEVSSIIGKSMFDSINVVSGILSLEFIKPETLAEEIELEIIDSDFIEEVSKVEDDVEIE